jgi:hypothetical protein
MTAPDNGAQFASPADAIFDLVEQLVDCSVRMSRLEQAQAAAAADPLADILARLDAFDARLTALEKRQRRAPPFPITVIENHVIKDNPLRRLHELNCDVNVERCERTRADDAQTRELAAMQKRLAVVEAGVGNGDLRQRVEGWGSKYNTLMHRVAALEAQGGGDEKGDAPAVNTGG